MTGANFGADSISNHICIAEWCKGVNASYGTNVHIREIVCGGENMILTMRVKTGIQDSEGLTWRCALGNNRKVMIKLWWVDAETCQRALTSPVTKPKA